jgi:CDGSH-type Zn-finger protein
MEIRDREGNVIRTDTRMALCRCGHSANKPFCDDSHYRVGFVSNDPHLGTGHGH